MTPGSEQEILGRLGIIELTLFCPGDEGTPLCVREDEDWTTAVVFGVADANAIGLQAPYLNAIAVKVTERTLPPKGPADIG